MTAKHSAGRCILVGKSSIALIGAPGSGKSTVGPLLAAALHGRFVDLDKTIETMQHCSIPDLFAAQGERAFRLAEWQALAAVTAEQTDVPSVLASGGGIVETGWCRTCLQDQWLVVWLQAKVSTLVERLSSTPETRPLFAGADDLAAGVSQLLARRERLYRETAALAVSVDGLDASQVAARVLTELREHGLVSND